MADAQPVPAFLKAGAEVVRNGKAQDLETMWKSCEAEFICFLLTLVDTRF